MPRVEEVAPPSSATWFRRAWATARRSFSLGGGSFGSGDRLLAEWLGGGAPIVPGVTPITEATALNLSAVWSAVNLISSTIASLPLHLHKRLEGGGKERMTWKPLYRLLHDDVSPQMTSFTFRQAAMAHVLMSGNCYAEIERDKGHRPVALWLLVPSSVAVERSVTGDVLYRVSIPGERDVLIARENMLHVKGLGFDGVTGYSVIRKARASLTLSASVEEFSLRFFGQGAHHGGILAHPGKLSDAAHQRLQRTQSESGGLVHAHRIKILEEGMQWIATTIAPEDAQMLSSRQFQTIEVARWFGLSPSKLGDLSRSTHSNVAEEQLAYVRDCVTPWVRNWESELNRTLIAPSERGLEVIEFTVDGLLRGDPTQRTASYSAGRAGGWYSVNDIRLMESLNPVEGGDVYSPPAQTPGPAPAPAPAAPAPAPAPEPARARRRWTLRSVDPETGEVLKRISVDMAEEQQPRALPLDAARDDVFDVQDNGGHGRVLWPDDEERRGG